jgi:hypothetical protein
MKLRAGDLLCAKPNDRNFADIVAVDEEIIAWLERRERRRRGPPCPLSGVKRKTSTHSEYFAF